MVEEKRLLAAGYWRQQSPFLFTVTLNFLVYGLALPNAGYVYIMRGVNPAIYTSRLDLHLLASFMSECWVSYSTNTGD